MRLPATSANLGAGFDAAAVALDFFLDIEAEPAQEFSIHATGRDARSLQRTPKQPHSRRLQQAAEGKRQASHAAGDSYAQRNPSGHGLRLVGSRETGGNCHGRAFWRTSLELLTAFWRRPALLEGHPDNAAACWLGGFVAAASEGRKVHLARVVPPPEWRAIVVLPPDSLATSKARAVLPESYCRADVSCEYPGGLSAGSGLCSGPGRPVARGHAGSHSPAVSRSRSAPCCRDCLPLAGAHGILGVALSGAGPAVLVIVRGEDELEGASAAMKLNLKGLPEPEFYVCQFEKYWRSTFF